MKINSEYKKVFNYDILKLEENKKTFYIKNAKGVIKVKVDGGVLIGK